MQVCCGSRQPDDSAVDVPQMEKLWEAHSSCIALLHCQLERTMRVLRRFPITNCTYVFAVYNKHLYRLVFLTHTSVLKDARLRWTTRYAALPAVYSVYNKNANLFYFTYILVLLQLCEGLQ